MHDGRLFTFALCINHFSLPLDIRLLILSKAKINRNIELYGLQPPPYQGKSTYAKRRRAKKLHMCYKCGNHFHANDGRCRWKSGMLQMRNQDRLQWIKEGKSKETETPSSWRNSLKQAVDDLLDSICHDITHDRSVHYS